MKFAKTIIALSVSSTLVMAHPLSWPIEIAKRAILPRESNSTQLQFKSKPFITFVNSKHNKGDDSDIVIDLADCNVDGTSDPAGIRWSKIDKNTQTKCQTFFAWPLPYIDPNAYVMQLSDTLKRCAWDVTERKHGGKTTPMMESLDPIWQLSQQIIVKCDDGGSDGYFGKGCTLKFKETGMCLMPSSVADFSKGNGDLQARNCEGNGADLAKWDLRDNGSPFSQDSHQPWKQQ